MSWGRNPREEPSGATLDHLAAATPKSGHEIYRLYVSTRKCIVIRKHEFMAAIEVTICQRAITRSDGIVAIVEKCDKSVPSCRSSLHAEQPRRRNKSFYVKTTPRVLVKNALV